MATIEQMEEAEVILTTLWAPRDTVMKEDRSILALTEPKKIPGFTTATLNEPKVQFDTSKSILSASPFTLRIPIDTNATPEEQDRMNKTERFLIGIFREFDRNQFNRGRGTWMEELAHWACSGWISVFPLVEKINNKPMFRCEFYDPITVYPDWGIDGLLKVLRVYPISPNAAMQMAKRNNWAFITNKLATEAVKVRSLWEMVDGKPQNTIDMDSIIVKPAVDEPFLSIPVFVLPVGGSPFGPIGGGDVDYISSIGENIIAVNKGQNKQMNKWVGLLMQIVQDVAYPSLMDMSETGEGSGLTQKQLGSGSIIPRKVGEPIEVLKHAGAPGFELGNIFQFLGRGIQKGGLPEIIHGGLPFEISGFMGSQLYAAVKHKLRRQILAMTQVTRYVAIEMIRQYSTGKFPKVTLTVENPRRVGKGETFMEEFSPKDIPEVAFVDVEYPLETMVDKAQQITMARQALAPPQLLSRQTLHEDWLGVQDSTLEMDRIENDQMSDLEGVKIIKAVENLYEAAAAAKAQGRLEKSNNLFRYAQLLEQQLLPKQQPTGAPQPGGMPPEQLPGELGAAGVSPDVLAAMMGKQPTGGTPGARTRGAERRGGLMLPGMEGFR